MPVGWPEVYVLRHGQTEWNAVGRMQGGQDSALTGEGRAQAVRQGRILAGCDLNGFEAWCSPQGRAIATAAVAVVGRVAHVRTDDRLREIGVGEWEGRLRREIPELAGAEDADGVGLQGYDLAPGGEGLAALEARCRDFLRDRSTPMVIVTHGVTSRVLRLLLTGRPLSEIDRIGGGQGVVYHLAGGVQRVLDQAALSGPVSRAR
ncbi:probable phosphoglycerate mutase [Roseovarius azorensis]|uniref:Probable phosphoglycerate mutase n=1 Tax=Roseovarius azorensis TaxID=1287727 RepID=A0A1H7LXZ8_9RHOB|nr:histidine phosphatase family protein [Roseovarius azorensis]SEL03628.1 probable phosphoglycerate mutase [Roseovarius azorensis]